jgi:hypothetical protein
VKLQSWEAWQGRSVPACSPRTVSILSHSGFGQLLLGIGFKGGREVRKNLGSLFLARVEASVSEKAAVTGCPKSGGANGSEIIRGEPSPQCDR